MINKTQLKRAFLCLSASTLLFHSCQKEIISPEVESADPNQAQKATVVNLNNSAIPTNSLYTVDSLGKRIQIFSESASADVVKDRMQLSFAQTDFLPTALYAKQGDVLQINVQLLAGGALPKLLIGTYKRYGVSFTPQEVQLQNGNNTITASKRGALWIRYAGNGSSKVKITFVQGGRSIPTFVKNKTSQTTFANTINSSDTAVHDILLVGQNVMAILPKAITNFKTQNNNLVLQKFDQVWDIEDRLSGLDGSSSLHEPNKFPHSMSIMEPDFAGAVAGNFGTGYSYPSNFFETDSYESWFQRHEQGHMHQQRWDWHAEIMADFYAVSTGINLGLPANKIGRDGAWATIWTRVKAYFNKPEANRDYSTIWGDGDIQTNRYLGSAMMIQLKYAFGDTFYHQLHKITREERPVLSTASAKYEYFMRKACEISGYDLTVFFKKWGFKYPNAYSAIAAMNLPKPVVDPSFFTDTERPILENGGIYQIATALNQNVVLDVNSSTPVNGTAITLWSKNNPVSNNQKFLARRLADGTFALKIMSDTTKVIAVKGASSVAGTAIHAYTFDGGVAQKWTMETAGNSLFKLKSSIADNRYLDVYNSQTTSGTKVQIWTSGTGNNQKFKFIKQ